MQQRSDNPLIMPWPLLTSLIGLAFCAWTAYGNTIDICISAGCAVTQHISVGGISLWWFGCISFAILVVLSFSGRPFLGVLVAGACLLADVGFLLLMVLTASCLSCLIVAILFALTYSAFRHSGKKLDERVKRSWLVLLWLLLFIGNIGGLLRENMMPWSIRTSQTADVNVYFSPTCPSCMNAISAFSNSPVTAFFPIAKDDNDLIYVARMQYFLNQGNTIIDALTLARESSEVPEDFDIFDEMLLRLRLYFNSSYLARNGFDVVPIIEYKGLPGFLSSSNTAVTNSVKPVNKNPTIHSSSHIPKVVSRLAPGSLVEPEGSKPKIILGSGAFTYNAQKQNAGSVMPVNANSQGGSDFPLDLGVSGACGGASAPPCPD